MSALPAVINTGPPPLSDTEERFAHAYVTHLCATTAYLEVFPHVTNKSARTLGSRWFAKVNVKARIRELVGQVVTGSVMSKQEVLEELSLLGRSDLTDILEQHESGVPVIADVKQLAPGVRRTIKSIEVKRYDPIVKDGETIREGFHILKFQCHDKKGALEQLAKYHKLYDELLPSGVKEVIVRLVRE